MQTCKTCLYHAKEQSTDTTGQCRRYPPTFRALQIYEQEKKIYAVEHTFDWPPTFDEEFCGEFKLKKTYQVTSN